MELFRLIIIFRNLQKILYTTFYIKRVLSRRALDEPFNI